jgi:hypothetical protein
MSVEPDRSPTPSPTAESPPLDQPTPTYCATHPKVETYLRCGRCETPICPRCLVMTPVGARCKNCARLRKLPTFQVRPLDFLRGALGGLGAAALGSIVMAMFPRLGFFALLLTLALGYVVGEATTLAANRKRGTPLAIAAALAVPLGLVLGRVLFLSLIAGARADLGTVLVIATTSIATPIWSLLLLLVAMGVAFSRVR